MAAMISSFPGDGCWHPGLSLPLVYLPLLVVVVVCSELHWSVPSIVSSSDSVVSSHPCLSMIRVSMPPLYLPHTSSVILKTLPCSPLLAASSAWLARSFMWKWRKELWKGHWERRMWHHEWQWREATGNLHHLWFCYWRDALSTPRPCTPPTEERERQEPDWPPDDQQDVEVITARRPREKRSWCGKWPPPCDRIQSKRVTTLWRGEAVRP